MLKTAGACIAELETVERPLRRSVANELSAFASQELRLGQPTLVTMMLATQGSYDHACELADQLVGPGGWTISPDPARQRQRPPQGYLVLIGMVSGRSRFPALAVVAAVLKWSLGGRG